VLIRGNCRRWCAARQSFLHRLDVTSERTRTSLLLRGAGDFDLELLESRTLDEHTQELVFRAPPIRQLERLQSVTIGVNQGRTAGGMCVKVIPYGSDVAQVSAHAGGGWVQRVMPIGRS
jgi:hypothetical protein